MRLSKTEKIAIAAFAVFGCLIVAGVAVAVMSLNDGQFMAQATVGPPTSTAIPSPAPTKTSTPNKEQVKARWGTVDIRDLVKNPDKYKDQELHYRGTVITAEEDGQASYFQILVPTGKMVNETYNVLIVWDGSSENIYNGTEIEIWGHGRGSIMTENLLGGTIRLPVVVAEYLTYFS